MKTHFNTATRYDMMLERFVACFWTIVMLSGVFCTEASGCAAYNTDFWVGRTQDEVETTDATTTYVSEMCSTAFWVRVAWNAGNYPPEDPAADNPFEIKIYEWDGDDWNHVVTTSCPEATCDEEDDPDHNYEKVFEVGDGEVSGLGSHKIKATVRRIGTNDEDDSDNYCWVKSVQVVPYILSTFTTKLDDWVDSPKYLFHGDNAIYIQVQGLGTDPTLQETIEDAVQIKSDSDASGDIKITLKETGLNTQIFRNSLVSGELLYLADSSCECNGDTIEVADEEDLKFRLRCPLIGTPTSFVDSCDVVVDKAEVAAVDGTDTLDANEFFNYMMARDWLEVYPQGLYDRNHSKASGDDDKCVELGNKADIMYIAGHCSSADNPTRIYGQSGYGLDIHGSVNNLQVADVGGTWDEELEWLILAACSTCKINDATPRTGPGTEWLGTMTGKVHGVFGYRYGAPGSGTPTTDITIAHYFVYNLPPRTVTSAWMYTNWLFKTASFSGIYSPLNAVAISRDDNYDDTLDTTNVPYLVSKDSTDTAFTYYWIYWEGQISYPYVDQDSVEMRSFTY